MKRAFIYVICLTLTVSAFSQVTIGTSNKPADYSILEISTKNKNGGILMPQILNNSVRSQIQATFSSNPTGASGLTIYNLANNSLELWSGSRWETLGANVWMNPASTTSATIGDSIISFPGAVRVGSNVNGHFTAGLELTDPTKGLKLANVTLKGNRDTEPIASAITDIPDGLLIYNTGENVGLPIKGFMYWDRDEWRYLNGESAITPEIGDLVKNSATLEPDNYVTGVEYTGIMKVDYRDGNGGYYSEGTPYVSNGLTFTLLQGKAEAFGTLVYSVKGVPQQTAPTQIVDVPVMFLGEDKGPVTLGGVRILPSLQYTISANTAVPTGTTGSTVDFVNYGSGGTVLNWRKDEINENISTIVLPQDGSYVFSFRLYGGTTGENGSIPVYISAFKQDDDNFDTPQPEDYSKDILMDIAEMTITKIDYGNLTYSINLTVPSGRLGDRIYFKIAASNFVVPFSWTLDSGGNGALWNKKANRTSMFYWKI